MSHYFFVFLISICCKIWVCDIWHTLKFLLFSVDFIWHLIYSTYSYLYKCTFRDVLDFATTTGAKKNARVNVTQLQYKKQNKTPIFTGFHCRWKCSDTGCSFLNFSIKTFYWYQNITKGKSINIVNTLMVL